MVEDVEIEIACCAFSIVLDVILEHHHVAEGLHCLIIARAGHNQNDVLRHEGGLFWDARLCVRNFVFAAYQNAFAFLALGLGAKGNTVFGINRECCRGGGCAHGQLLHYGFDGEDVGFVFAEGGVDGVGGGGDGQFQIVY